VQETKCVGEAEGSRGKVCALCKCYDTSTYLMHDCDGPDKIMMML
jgi:hypothetical protein